MMSLAMSLVTTEMKERGSAMNDENPCFFRVRLRRFELPRDYLPLGPQAAFGTFNLRLLRIEFGLKALSLWCEMETCHSFYTCYTLVTNSQFCPQFVPKFLSKTTAKQNADELSDANNTLRPMPEYPTQRTKRQFVLDGLARNQSRV